MTPSDQLVTAHQDEPIDLLVWRATGGGSGAVEAALAANPGLALSGQALPDGTAVTLPGAAVLAARELPLIQLWD